MRKLINGINGLNGRKGSNGLVWIDFDLMLVGDASTEGAWDPPMKLVHVQLLVFVDYQTPEFKPALILDYQCYQTFAKPEKGHLNGHLLTFIDDQLVLPVGQKPLLLILRWRRPTLVQVAGGKGAAKRSGWWVERSPY